MELLLTLLPLASFAFVTSATPGPNNILLTASGIRFGFVRTIPHILGIQLGVALQLALCAMGLTLMQLPGFADTIRVAGTAYLVYLAWQLRRSAMVEAQPDEHSDFHQGRPFTVIQGLLFQFINPKAWIMTLTAGTLFLPTLESQWLSVLLLCGTFCLVGGPSSGSWALIGAAVKRYLTTPKWQRRFSLLMVLLTLYSATTLWMT